MPLYSLAAQGGSGPQSAELVVDANVPFTQEYTLRANFMNIEDAPAIKLRVTVKLDDSKIQDLISQCGLKKEIVEMELLSDGKEQILDLNIW